MKRLKIKDEWWLKRMIRQDLGFKPLEQRDLPVLLELMRKYYLFDGLEFAEESARSAVAALIENPYFGQAWLIQKEGKTVGYPFSFR